MKFAAMKNIIVTGAKGNLGASVVNNFLEKKYFVIGTTSSLESIGIKNKPPNLELFAVDLSDPSASVDFVDTAIKKHNRIDGAVLTVGGFAAGKISDVSGADFEKMFVLNFNTAFNIVQPVLKQMLKQKEGGRIILIGSKPGMSAIDAKGAVAYGFSKSLIFRLSEIINMEGKNKNIYSTVIVPGTIDTPQNRAAMPNADFTSWIKAEDIAAKIEKIFSQQENTRPDEIIEINENL